MKPGSKSEVLPAKDGNVGLDGALPGRVWRNKTTTRVISTTDHHKAAKVRRSINRSKGGWKEVGSHRGGVIRNSPSAVSWQRPSYHKADGLKDVTSLFFCQGTSTVLVGTACGHTQPPTKPIKDLAGDTD